MRPTHRWGAVLTAIALTLPLTALAAPRHDVDVPLPGGHGAARVWVAPGEQTSIGSDLRAAPQTPDLSALPGPRAPEDEDEASAHVPTVEPPDADDGPHLPDLAPLPAWGVHVDRAITTITVDELALATVERRDPFDSDLAIKFGTTIVNRGRHSLEVVGVPRPTGDRDDPARVDAVQCVRFAGPRFEGAGRVCQAYEPVGSLSFHPQHGHFHIDGFAQYRLRKDVGGRPGPVVANSEKVGFCMGDTDWHGPHYDVALDTGWYRECRHTAPHVPVTLRQGISPNWGDSYGPDLRGQAISLKGVPDGVYWIQITVNPPEYRHIVNLRETTRANNSSFQRVRIYHDGHERAARAW